LPIAGRRNGWALEMTGCVAALVSHKMMKSSQKYPLVMVGHINGRNPLLPLRDVAQLGAKSHKLI